MITQQELNEQIGKTNIEQPYGKTFIIPKDPQRPEKGYKVSVPQLSMFMKSEYDIKVYKGQFRIRKNHYYSQIDDIKLLISKAIPEEYRIPSNIRDCEELLCMDYDLIINDEDLAPENYISFANGVLDTRKMDFKAYDDEEADKLIFINQVGYNYNPNAARCKFADSYFDCVTNGSIEDINFLYQILGVLISGYRSFKNIFYFSGVKDSGKSVFMHLAENLLTNSDGSRDYSNVGLRVLTDELSKEFAGIIGKRANICAETPAMNVSNDTLLKQLSGGDTVNASMKFKASVEFVNKAMLIFSGNTVPNFFVSDKSSISERMLIYKFKNAIPKSKQVKGLEKKINMEYVIQRAIEQLQIFIDNNQEFTVPDEIYSNQEEMLMSSDTIYKFFKECIVFTDNKEDRISNRDLYTEYTSYLVKEGHLRTGYGDLPDLTNFKITQYIFTSEMKKYIGEENYKRNLSYGKQLNALDSKADVFINIRINVESEPVLNQENKVIQGKFHNSTFTNVEKVQM
ncbi:DNA primase family protein [Parasporobacterium paucivorans]|uniref:Phage/plasmid primase, P4 family, C-terminal domain-containing protein n=1 Tax=Parasporobacterium paucivorans DSM 15970 TaxID=1122934 RepID=A0A1M6F3U0_9FIRM|nr:phage/plasmid primase, P4 family [Parasporobacterium paucivorans]SHI92414.1 phage/plasmid primase, P4 family, C-terminal domain-containing protein [Parasporobacterium paucivorans DSM 15970]